MDLLRTISTPHPPPWAGIEPNQLNQPNEASTVTPTCCCYPVGVGSSVPFRPGGAQLREEAPSTNYKQQRQISKTESLSPSPLHSIRFDPPPPHKPKKKKKTAAARRRLLLLRSTLTAAAAATPLLPSAATDLGWGARLLSPPR